MAPLNQVETLVCRCVPQCSTLGKIKNRPHMFVHPSGQMQTPFQPLCSRRFRSLCSFKLESFKVIALDKHSVNRNLSSSFLGSKSHESSSLGH